MKRFVLALISATFALPLAADGDLPEAFTRLPAMNQEAFDAATQNHTMSFGFVGDGVYGVEHYLPNRRVLWYRHDRKECQNGIWYEKTWSGLPAICFVYKGKPEHHCWILFDEGDHLRAYNLKHPTPDAEYSLAVSSEPMPCYSPFLGS